MAKKTARKTAKKGKAPKKTARKAKSLEPKPVKTGKGPTPMDVGSDLVQMFNAGKLPEIEKKWWAPGIVSTEGFGLAMSWTGRKAVEAKNAWWMQDHEIHSASAEGPYVGATGFAVKYRMDVETKSTGKRESMEEVGVYTIRNGKIVSEEFMYKT